MADKEEINEERPTKNWLTTLILCVVFGFFGVHRIYAGRVGEGLLMLYWTIVSSVITYFNTWVGLCCFIVVGAFVVYDIVTIALKNFKDCYGREIVNENLD